MHLTIVHSKIKKVNSSVGWYKFTPKTGMWEVSLCSWFLFWQFFCTKISASSSIFSLFLTFYPDFTLFFCFLSVASHTSAKRNRYIMTHSSVLRVMVLFRAKYDLITLDLLCCLVSYLVSFLFSCLFFAVVSLHLSTGCRWWLMVGLLFSLFWFP